VNPPSWLTAIDTIEKAVSFEAIRVFFKKFLKQRHARRFAGNHGFGIPDGGLYLTDVAAAHHEHTKSGLANTAANR
jgi:hypothetical protein